MFTVYWQIEFLMDTRYNWVTVIRGIREHAAESPEHNCYRIITRFYVPFEIGPANSTHHSFDFVVLN